MRANLIILVLTVVLSIVYLYSTTEIPFLEIGDPLGPRAFPYLVGIGMLVAAAMLAFEIWRDNAKHVPQEKVDLQPNVVVILLAVCAWTGLYYWIFVPVGYILATALFLLPLMAYFHPRKWISNIASAVLFPIGTYVIFLKLEVSLPMGLLPF